MDNLSLGLLAVGYLAAVAVLIRFVPVVRERRSRWLTAHHFAMVAIVAGWALRGRPTAVVANAAWLVASSAWYVMGGRHSAGAAESAEVQQPHR